MQTRHVLREVKLEAPLARSHPVEGAPPPRGCAWGQGPSPLVRESFGSLTPRERSRE